MNLVKVNYYELSPRQKETYNFHQVAWILAGYGYNSKRVPNDPPGTDFVAYHKDGGDPLNVQLTARMTIDRKYMHKNLYICFPIFGVWYLILHDELVHTVGKRSGALKTDLSWLVRGRYSWPRPSQNVRDALKRYALKG